MLGASLRCCLCILGLAASAWAADTPRVEIRDREIWVTRDGVPTQLTDDGILKTGAILSNAADRIAYYEECPEDAGCVPSVVILDLHGNLLRKFEPVIAASGAGGHCVSILGISWTASDAGIGLECHLNPSLSEYVEFDLKSGKYTHDLLGFGFTAFV